MAETSAQRITQLESIVNELTTRIAAEPTNVDLPPLLAAAQAELTALEATAAADQAAADAAAKAAADQAAADAAAKAAADQAAADAAAKAAADKAAAKAAAVAAAKVAKTAPAPAPAPAKPTLAIKPLPPTVPASMRATRPNPAARRPAPVAGTCRAGK